MRNLVRKLLHSEPLKAFISYSHHDSNYREALDGHLGVLQRSGGLAVWYDRHIKAGARWDKEIKDNLLSSDLILFLLSPDFIKSDYCWFTETTVALARDAIGEAIVIPILIRPISNWEYTPFAQLNVLPTGAMSVSEWDDNDKALKNVADGIAGRLQISDFLNKMKDKTFSEWKISVNDSEKTSLDEICGLLHEFLIRQICLEFLLIVPFGKSELRVYGDEKLLSSLPEILRSDTLPEKLRGILGEPKQQLGALINYGFKDLPEAPEISEYAYENESLIEFKSPFDDILLGTLQIPMKKPFELGLGLLDTGKHEFSEEETIELKDMIARIFYTFIFTPLSEIHVDLHPFKDHGGVPDALVGTEVGRNLLYQDLELKKVTAELTHPTTELGKAFWAAFEDDFEIFGDKHPVLRLCIKPGKLSIAEKQENDNAIATLEKMSFEIEAELENMPPETQEISKLFSFVRTSLIPEIKNKVQTCDRFKLLRQILSISMFAIWYDRHLGKLVKQYYSQNPLPPFKSDKYSKDLNLIVKEYQKLYSEGAWSYSQKIFDPESFHVQNRIYYSGMIDFR